MAKPSRPAAEEILTIEAFWLRRKCGTASLVQLNCPVRQISRQRSQSSGFISSTFDVGPAMPALLTSTSRPPSFASASANRLFTAARSETSQRVEVIAGSLVASADSAASSTSQVWTRAPSAAKRRAIARPMPLPPAVTSTRKPLSSRSMIAPQDVLGKIGRPPDRARRASATLSFSCEENKGIDKASVFCNSNGDQKSRQAGWRLPIEIAPGSGGEGRNEQAKSQRRHRRRRPDRARLGRDLRACGVERAADRSAYPDAEGSTPPDPRGIAFAGAPWTGHRSRRRRLAGLRGGQPGRGRDRRRVRPGMRAGEG